MLIAVVVPTIITLTRISKLKQDYQCMPSVAAQKYNPLKTVNPMNSEIFWDQSGNMTTLPSHPPPSIGLSHLFIKDNGQKLKYLPKTVAERVTIIDLIQQYFSLLLFSPSFNIDLIALANINNAKETSHNLHR